MDKERSIKALISFGICSTSSIYSSTFFRFIYSTAFSVLFIPLPAKIFPDKLAPSVSNSIPKNPPFSVNPFNN